MIIDSGQAQTTFQELQSLTYPGGCRLVLQEVTIEIMPRLLHYP
jgi:hypothetical protein